MNVLYPLTNNAAPFGFAHANAESDTETQKGNPKAACTNCRQSHVACSHEQPCSRCLNLGIEDSCRYLPRKRRTDFKKRKQEIEKTKKKKAIANDAPTVPFTPASGEENEGLLNATLAQLFGEEYPFPLLDTNQPGHEGFVGQLIPRPADGLYNPDEEETEESTDWISKLSKAISPRLEGNDQSGWSLSPGQPAAGKALEYDGLPASPAFGVNHGEAFGSGLELIAPPSRSEEDQRLMQYSDNTRTSSKTLRLLQELKQKNDRLEQLLRNSLSDIQRLKERELMYQQQVQNFMREEQKSFQLFSLGPARDFDQPGMMPGIAMFSLAPSRRHQMLQCNQAFQTLVGRSWQELSQGFTCCQMFPQRLLPLLRQRFASMCSKEGPSSAEAELLITRPDGEEVPIRAYSHVIFDDAGEPLYKMFYAFTLATH